MAQIIQVCNKLLVLFIILFNFEIVKSEVKPILWASNLKILAKTEWNVPIHIFLDSLSPIIDEILNFISLAALLVNVRAKISKGSTPFSTRWTIL